MKTIEERAVERGNCWKKQFFFDERCNDLAGNIAYQEYYIGASQQRDIDIKKFCNIIKSKKLDIDSFNEQDFIKMMEED